MPMPQPPRILCVYVHEAWAPYTAFPIGNNTYQTWIIYVSFNELEEYLQELEPPQTDEQTDGWSDRHIDFVIFLEGLNIILKTTSILA